MSDYQPIATAPKDRRIILLLPACGAWAEAPWFGCWSWTDNEWVVDMPFTIEGRITQISQLPNQPTHWMEAPQRRSNVNS